MEKIKKSFTKTFLILLIANVIITAFECARIPLYIYLDGALPKRGEIETASQYLKANFDARNLWNMGINLVTYLIEMPFLPIFREISSPSLIAITLILYFFRTFSLRREWPTQEPGTWISIRL